MTVTIYSCSCETIVLNKTSYLTSLASFSGTVRDEVDIVNPRILVAGNVIAGNYCYIDDFASYYYITEKTVVRDGLTDITLKRDPLMTAKTGIASSPCIARRSTDLSKTTAFIHDNFVKTNAYTMQQQIAPATTNIFSYNGNLILLTSG